MEDQAFKALEKYADHQRQFYLGGKTMMKKAQ